jgi:hypothetical protein
LAILADSENLGRLKLALDDLEAELIAVPPFEREYLERGLAVHFRCQRSDVAGFRVDVMSVMRGVDPFPELWERRTVIALDDGQTIDLISVPDLVKAKKTQRDRDWPMIRSLVDAHYEQFRNESTDERAAFWLREGRLPNRLIELAGQFQSIATRVALERPLILLAISGASAELANALAEEQKSFQALDRQYWQPLEAELEQLRLNRRRRK